MPGPHHHHSGWGGWGGGFRPYPISYPVYSPDIVVASDACQCKTGNQLEQKIKENPLLFTIGALLIGWFLAKKH